MDAQPLPRLTQARVALTRSVEVVDEFGHARQIEIPNERALTLFVDKRELVTLMTLGAEPELLALGYLRNQWLVDSVDAVESVTVDWEVGAVAVKTRAGIADIAERTAQRIVTTGCGQGTVFGRALDDLASIRLASSHEARIAQSQLVAILERMRVRDSIHRRAGSVHGCALFAGSEPLVCVEDVGRHNAIDTIAGWMWMNGVVGADKVFYTTGRLTSEMVMKSASMGVAIVVSRNGVTQMGFEMATRLGMALFGRAVNRHFLCYTGAERFDAEPQLAAPGG